MSPPLPSCGGLIPSKPQDCLEEGGKMLSGKPRICLDRKPSEREETLCVGAAAGGAAHPAWVPLVPKGLWLEGPLEPPLQISSKAPCLDVFPEVSPPSLMGGSVHWLRSAFTGAGGF